MWSDRVRPSCHPSFWPKWGWPQACLALPGPLAALGHWPCRAMQASGWCPCHLVAAVPGLLTSLLHPQPPTAVPQGLQGHPCVPMPWLALGSERWGRFLWDGTRSMSPSRRWGGHTALSLQQVGGSERLHRDRWTLFDLGHRGIIYVCDEMVPTCPACPACCNGPAPMKSPWRGKLGLWGAGGVL